MKRILFFALLWLHCEAGIDRHYRSMEFKGPSIGPEGVDYVYMINLDQRSQRWIDATNQLKPYKILPQRFPGIYGWTLPVDVLNDMSVQFLHGMWTGQESVMHFPPDGDGTPQFIYLNGSCYGKSCFSGWTVKGTIGCSLSHLSVLNDAFESEYETIWILEDDISVEDDPHKLTRLIAELDALVGHEGWDVLYTDFDYLHVDQEKDLTTQIPMMWRPDMPGRDMRFLAEHENINDHFMKIGSRMRAHSMIYRRCGIKKILDFYREHNNFLPYDQELALIPGIRTFVLKQPIVTVHEVDSDTRYKRF